MRTAAAVPLLTAPCLAVVPGCGGYSIDGTASMQAAGTSAVLRSTRALSSSSTIVAITAATFTDSTGRTTVQDDASVDLRCGSEGRAEDSAVTYDQQWACLPRASGRARITISAGGPQTVSIVDEDPPESGSVSSWLRRSSARVRTPCAAPSLTGRPAARTAKTSRGRSARTPLVSRRSRRKRARARLSCSSRPGRPSPSGS